MVSDWMFFSITINLSIANLSANATFVLRSQKLVLASSCILVALSGFILALSMYIPELKINADMTGINIVGIVLVILTAMLYITILIKSKDIYHD